MFIQLTTEEKGGRERNEHGKEDFIIDKCYWKKYNRRENSTRREAPSEFDYEKV
jgi:hypothetical protein